MIGVFVNLGTYLKLSFVSIAAIAFYHAFDGPWPEPMQTMPVADFYRSASGTPTALHTISWYVANGAERTATLQWCHESSERGHMPDCNNAERASAGTWIKRDPAYYASLHDMERPEYWRGNPFARAGVLAVCQHPDSAAYSMQRPYCSVARQVENEEKGTFQP